MHLVYHNLWKYNDDVQHVVSCKKKDINKSCLIFDPIDCSTIHVVWYKESMLHMYLHISDTFERFSRIYHHCLLVVHKHNIPMHWTLH